jgi:hypothetical protein
MAVEVLADELDQAQRSGIILATDESSQSCVFFSTPDQNLLAAVAQAMDENPELIGLFLDAAWMVKLQGNSRNDPAFRRVHFVPRGVQ